MCFNIFKLLKGKKGKMIIAVNINMYTKTFLIIKILVFINFCKTFLLIKKILIR